MKRNITALFAVLLCFALNSITAYAVYEPVEKVDPDVIDAMNSGQDTIPVIIWYKNIDRTEMEDRLMHEAEDYAETLDRTVYTNREIEKMQTDYYLEHLRAETKQLYKDTAIALATELGLKEGSYSYGSYSPEIDAYLTPEQIIQSAAHESVKNILLVTPSTEWIEATEPTEITAPTEPATELTSTTVFGDFNHDGEVNASDAAIMLIYAAEHGAGTFSGTFEEYVNS